MNVRELAWRVLRSGGSTSLRSVQRVARRAELDERDRALLRRLVGTEVRRRGTLHAMVRHFARPKPAPDLAAHLHIGFVQLYFLDKIPDHAAVSETVSAVMSTLGGNKGHFANAVLREAIRARESGSCGDLRRDVVRRDLHFAQPVFHDPREHPLLWAEDALSMPAALMKRWQRRYTWERAVCLALGAIEEPALSLRVTGDPAQREAIRETLLALGVLATRGEHPSILVVPATSTADVLRSPLFVEGRITVQGETALRAAELVEAQRGERVLDLCASPGGKTAVLAQTGASIVAGDIGERRLARIGETLTRLSLRDRVEIREPREAADLGLFDAVLVDAPCSNTGVLAKRPGARWRFSRTSQESLAVIQATLLEEGAKFLRPGGRLVYSTCSIEPEENQRRIQELLDKRPMFTLEDEIAGLPDTRSSGGPVDGGYAARLRLR